MGHFFKTEPNPTQNFWTQPTPTHISLHPTQPNPSSTLDMAYRKLYTTTVTDKTDRHSTSQQSMKVIIQLQYSLTDSRVFHDVKNITQSSLHPTQPNPPKNKKNSDPTQTNHTQPNPWMDSTHDQL